MQVSVNVYDVTNTANDNTNGMITRLNSITRELNLGGVFHGAVQLEEVEWSFGYCESGTGVYCCRARSNSLYSFREHIELGVTHKTKQEIKEILTRFKRTWPGTSYDLLQRNCCHFCEELCVALEVPSPPAWLNRFAQGADATVKFTNEASALAKRVGSNISSTAQQSAVWLRELSQRVLSQISLPPSFDGGAASPPGDDGGGAVSPLYARSTSPSPRSCSPGSCSDSGARREGGSMGRLTSRLRQFGVGSGGLAAAAPATGLPASTPASSCDLASRVGAAPSPQQQPLAMALRQKWQELEASAGDGTKQFLFGLIKTKQTRLEEDEPVLGGGGGCDRPRSASHAPGSPGRAAWNGPTGHLAAGAAARDVSSSEPTQAPALQVICNSLLPPDVVGGTAPVTMTAAAVGASQAAASWQPALDTERWGSGSGMAGLAAPAETAATAATAMASGVTLVNSQPGPMRQPAPPAQHLLDM